MRRLLAAALMLEAMSAGCDRRGCRPRPSDATPVEAGPSVVDADADGGPDGDRDEAAEADADRAAPHDAGRASAPHVVAQRFLVAWGSRSFDTLRGMTGGRAAELVGHALEGETVETPLGRVSARDARPTAFAFDDVTISPEGMGITRVAFTVTLRFSGQEATQTRHVVLIRDADGIVVDWTGPSAGPDSGV
jgi:hypothetical protein